MTIDFWPAFGGTLAAIALWKVAPLLFNLAVFLGVATYINWAKVKRTWDIAGWVLTVLFVVALIFVKATE